MKDFSTVSESVEAAIRLPFEVLQAQLVVDPMGPHFHKISASFHTNMQIYRQQKVPFSPFDRNIYSRDPRFRSASFWLDGS